MYKGGKHPKDKDRTHMLVPVPKVVARVGRPWAASRQGALWREDLHRPLDVG
jgi:hypothetical protein